MNGELGSITATVYKYRSFSQGMALLRDRYAYFGSPLSFNDPFDCDWDLGRALLLRETYEPIVSAFCNHVRGRPPTDGVTNPAVLPGLARIRRQVEHLAEPARSSRIGALAFELFGELVKAEHQSLMRDLQVSQTRVFCTCDTVEETPMWAHYADNHHGIAIALDRPCLERTWHLKAMRVNYPPQITMALSPRDWVAIVCHGDFQAIDWASVRLEVLSNKSPAWSYEREVRFVYPRLATDPSPLQLQIPQQAIRAVHLGIKIRDEDKTELRAFLARDLPDVRVFETAQSRLEYKMVAQPLGSGEEPGHAWEAGRAPILRPC
jgi:hypothetical protein